MARARRSPSPTPGSLPAGKHKTASAFPEKKAESDPVDLEDGEITDEATGPEEVTIDNAELRVIEPTTTSELRPEIEPKTRPMLSVSSLSHDYKEESTPHVAPDDEAEVTVHSDTSGESIKSSPIPTSPIPVFESRSDRSDTNKPRALSPEELDLAKDVVLDLLGWGVQPEYLVEYGVSSHAIYRIFTDLHLRLPSNLAYFGPG